MALFFNRPLTQQMVQVRTQEEQNRIFIQAAFEDQALPPPIRGANPELVFHDDLEGNEPVWTDVGQGVIRQNTPLQPWPPVPNRATQATQTPRRIYIPRQPFKPKLNIFALDEDPVIAASFANDTHVSKMTTESAQILCGIFSNYTNVRIVAPGIYRGMEEINRQRLEHNNTNHTTSSIDYRLETLIMNNFMSVSGYNSCSLRTGPVLYPELYQPTHESHPSFIWASTSSETYSWLYQYFIALGAEYKRRYSRDHASIVKLEHVLSRIPDNLPIRGMTTPVRVVASPTIMTEYYGREYIIVGNTNTTPDVDPMPETWTNAVRMYRRYYCVDKFPLGKWTNAKIPFWFKAYHEDRGAKEVIVERKLRGKVVQTRSMLYP